MTELDELDTKVPQWRAECALKEVGIQTYGPNLIAMTVKVLQALDDAGDVPEERVEGIVDAHVGPQSICADCIYGLLRDSRELMCNETPILDEADSLIEALGMTLYSAIYAIAHAYWQQLHDAFEAFRELNS